MRIALTGGTGFVGSHILTELISHDHQVTALVRSDEEAAMMTANGASPAVIDLYDRGRVAGIFGDSDGAVHTASPGDETSANLDSAVVDAAIDAFGSNGRPYAHISGLWVFGSNSSITEESPYKAPTMVAWKEPIEQRILNESGMRGILIVSGTAYGDGGGGIPGVVLGSPRDDKGNLIMLGSGRQHWATIHVADLATAFRLALENDQVRGKFCLGNGLTPTVEEITEAAAVALGAPGAVPGSDEEAKSRLGEYFAEVLLLDQVTTAAKARAVIGWQPSHLGLTDEFRSGSYRS